MKLLLARVRAMLRRREKFTPDILTYGNVSLNRQNYELSSGESVVVLPKIEYQLMELFMLNKGICLSAGKFRYLMRDNQVEPGRRLFFWIFQKKVFLIFVFFFCPVQ